MPRANYQTLLSKQKAIYSLSILAAKNGNKFLIDLSILAAARMTRA